MTRYHSKNRVVSATLSLAAFLLSAAICIAAQSVGTIALENDRVELSYDLTRGTFNVRDRSTDRLVLEASQTRVADWASTESNRLRTAQSTSVRDDLGRGQRLTVECAAPGRPAVLSEFTLYGQTNSFLVLRTGMRNTTDAPLRVHRFNPLAGGRVFPGGDWTEVRTLNGDSGVNQAQVKTNWIRSSANHLLLTLKQGGQRRSVVLAALRTADFTKWAHTQSADADNAGVVAALEAYDPVGRLVAPDETYWPEDSFYFDAGTPDPFVALEEYGQRLRTATVANPKPYYFPTVCAWYAGVWKTKGAQNHPEKSKYLINTTAGLVEEIQWAKERGFLRYAPVAGRLVPDTYLPLNPQGWWDDAHWQKHGYYTAPYETTEKYGRGMHDAGGLAFSYLQPVIQPPHYDQRISLDFREAHRDWLLNQNLCIGGLDYSLPAVQEYVRTRFAALRGHVDGLMVDYGDDLWMMTLKGHSPEPRLGVTEWETISPGGRKIEFADRTMSATAFYRKFFATLREGIGPRAYIHERNLYQPNNDLTLGIVDLQRTSCDTDKISPDIVSRSGLRWFKNRVVLGYDMDSKELTDGWKIEGWTGSDADGRRMVLTMSYVAASRLLLANSFRDLSAEVVHDLSRTFPYPSEQQSARPIDAFVAAGWPRVYAFAVNAKWQQVTLFNNTVPTRAETISVPLSGEQAAGALGLAPDREYYIYDFWNDCLAGRVKGSASLEQTLRPGEARMLAIHEAEPHPQFISANRHLMQGYLDMVKVPAWNPGKRTLSGASQVVAGETYEIVLANNGFAPQNSTAKKGQCRIEPVPGNANLSRLKLDASESGVVVWTVTFDELPAVPDRLP